MTTLDRQMDAAGPATRRAPAEEAAFYNVAHPAAPSRAGDLADARADALADLRRATRRRNRLNFWLNWAPILLLALASVSAGVWLLASAVMATTKP